MQSRSTMKYHLIPTRMANIEKTRNNKCWRVCGEKEMLLHFWWECNLVQPLWRILWRLFKKLKIKLSYDSDIPLLGISVSQFSYSVMYDSLRPHGLQHVRPPCPSPTPGVYSNSCPLSQWWHLIISSSVVPFSSHLQSFPASGFFQMSQLFASGNQSIGASASASVLPMNIKDWFPLGWTGWISLLSKGFSRVFSNTTLQKHQFFSAQLSL